MSKVASGTSHEWLSADVVQIQTQPPFHIHITPSISFRKKKVQAL
jgi:hypothetical protein